MAEETISEMIQLADERGNAEEKDNEENETKSNSTVLIGIYFQVLRITTLNLIEQNFGVSGYMRLSWRAEKEEYESYQLSETNGTVREWTPKFDPFTVLQFSNGSKNDFALGSLSL